MLEVEGLTKRFGPLMAVDGLSFSVRPGEVLGFLGPNGAGKSTSMKMITGFLSPDRGTARICGHDILHVPLQAQRKLGYLPEGAPLYGEMTVRDFLDFVAAVRLPAGERAGAVRQVIDRLNLGSVLLKRIETLSKGFKRRVGLAQALLHDPEVLILDEPTDGLDPNQKFEVRSLIQSMAKDKVIVLSTHILEEVDAVCNRAMIIADGRQLFDGRPAELETRAKQHGAVIVGFGGQAPPLSELQQLAGVAEVESLPVEPPATAAFRLYPQAQTNLIRTLGQAACRHGWELMDLHKDRGKLDDVFRSMTATDQAA